MAKPKHASNENAEPHNHRPKHSAAEKTRRELQGGFSAGDPDRAKRGHPNGWNSGR